MRKIKDAFSDMDLEAEKVRGLLRLRRSLTQVAHRGVGCSNSGGT